MAKTQSWFFSNDNKKEHVKALDGLRGIAVILVMLAHSSFHNMFFHPLLVFSGIGKGGVYLFYVLSAFLLDRQIGFALIYNKADGSFWKRYFLRRFLRIFPLFIFALFVFWTLTLLNMPTVIQNMQDILNHIFLMEGKEVFWSVPVEFKYYILSPFILLICHHFLKWKLKNIFLFFLVVSTVTLAADLYFHFNRISTLKYLPVFLTGTFLAIYSLRSQTMSFISKWNKGIGMVGLAALLFCLIMNPNYMGDWMGMDTSNNGRKVMILYAVLCFVMLFAALYTEGIYKRLLETRFLRFIGVISFSMYLFHMPVIYFIKSDILYIPEGLKIYFFFGATIIISTVTFLLIERPMSLIRISKAPAVIR
jgi:peptidoglycan/LPS O-acetylase OafA/YrhL